MPPALIHHIYPKDPTLEKKHLSLVCKDHLKDSIEGISAKEQILLDFFFFPAHFIQQFCAQCCTDE